jgi:phosphate transport system permease protein
LIELFLKRLHFKQSDINFLFKANRIILDAVFKFLLLSSLIIAVAPLIVIFYYMIKSGLQSLNLQFFLTAPSIDASGAASGGILNSITGFFLIIFITLLISIIPAILIGLYIFEKKNTLSSVINYAVDLASSIPSIVFGVIIYLWVVKPMSGFSAFSGSIALSLIIIPIITKTTVETLKKVPVNTIESALALGATRYKIAFNLLIPCSVKGITNGILLGTARIAGETAPLILTVFGSQFVRLDPFSPVDSLPLTIYNLATGPFSNEHSMAWGASIVLVIIVFLFSFTARSIVNKWEK